ncbi:MAG: preprotein translocase subunit SecG [Candidatus Pacebacteria bacterium]|jgi:protein translocase SecG subunit|nr:preprotein translocase subunit SecG [Candidatus Paceibacterota bacterium]MDD4994551.1 preprotein translocase subunit SecG [Candidatus Paceibacterota bacterium]MDD5535245.1 preprotein translocase subunit SecG [Candidatus Paceibacterota bacterium]
MNPLTLVIAQIIVGILLIILVLLQQRGGGMGILGGISSQFYGTRRGLEKTIFIFTVALGILFIALSVISFLI